MFHKGNNRFEALGTVAGRMRGTGGLATGFGAKAMDTRRVGFVKVPFRNAVKAENQMVISLREEWLRTGRQRGERGISRTSVHPRSRKF